MRNESDGNLLEAVSERVLTRLISQQVRFLCKSGT